MDQVVVNNLSTAQRGEIWIDRDGRRYRCYGSNGKYASMYPLAETAPVFGFRLVPINDSGWLREE